MHQIQVIVNKDKTVNQRRCWMVCTEAHLGHYITLFTKNNGKTTYLKFHRKKNNEIYNICNLIKKSDEITHYLYFHLKNGRNYCLFVTSKKKY